MRASDMVELGPYLQRRPAALSGGQRQRVALARAIVREPNAFLMDEPLSNLDAKLREAMRTELKDLQMRLGTTFLFVTHDQVEAMTMGDRIGVLNGGRLEQVGTPYDIYRNPHNAFVAGFVGSPAINLLPGHMDHGRAVITPGSFELPLGTLPNGDMSAGLTFGIRPEDLQIVSGGPVAAQVHDVENYGTEQVVTLRVGTTHLRASVPSHVPIKVEEQVRFGWTPDKVMFFDTASGLNIGRGS
jgi:multiple sugar transport system ATP-binding protein